MVQARLAGLDGGRGVSRQRRAGSAVLSQIGLGRCLHAETSRRGGDMTSNTRVPKAEITGVYGAVLKKIGRKMFGEVPEPLEVMWHNRPATVAWRPLRETEGSSSDGQEVRRGENG